MAAGKYTVVYEKSGKLFKLCRIWFGGDGTYYVSSPYHPARKALLFKISVNFAKSSMDVSLDDAVDLGTTEDENRDLKLSHHPDGFVQFSGRGVLSGRYGDGRPRGMGVRSWPLARPTRGPAFGLTIRGVEHFAQASELPADAVVFREEEVVHVSGEDALMLEGHYFPALWRRFIRRDRDGTYSTSIVHPSQAALQLKTLLPPPRAALQGFLGIELYSFESALEDQPSPSFILAGPAGELRRNLDGETVGEGIYCQYPRDATVGRRSLDYPPQQDA